VQSTESDKGQSQNIFSILKKNFQIRIKYFKSQCSLEIIFGQLIKSKKLLQIQIKLLDPQIPFYKSEIQKNILSYDTCASSQAASEVFPTIPKWRMNERKEFRII